MKIIVRSFVIALALTGFVATTATPTHASAKAAVATVKTSAMPAPRCPLNTPGGCGMNNW
jgi:hypothetical protein